ncbi:MAG: hypothetical protein ACOYT4_00805 [Nanoarchaeota archaeon]
MENYRFDLGIHGDVILIYKDERINMGYSYNSKLPIFFWLYNFQVLGDNLFSDIKNLKDDFKISDEIIKLISDAKEFKAQLPMHYNEFNLNCPHELTAFSSGNNRIFYTFRVFEQTLLLERNMGKKEDIALELSAGSSKNLFQNFVGFIFSERCRLKMPRCIDEITAIIKSFN